MNNIRPGSKWFFNFDKEVRTVYTMNMTDVVLEHEDPLRRSIYDKETFFRYFSPYVEAKYAVLYFRDFRRGTNSFYPGFRYDTLAEAWERFRNDSAMKCCVGVVKVDETLEILEYYHHE